MTPSDAKVPKKTYRRPKLTVYGNLREITQTVSTGGTTTDKTTGMNKSR
ncbi:MAG: lasso peptide [Candidatus Eisenbacteria bacterium]|uniref:Lasso peptide n=1 Tax=Eiseniibacteriota bacterium TaxID=2212470 RepID=A0A538SVW5_UNCEI|nr:MAG: lasso peptide [Candidatus Eisenbacteria bacterium]